MARTGLLLVNLGTPDSPATGPVRRYLREFLSDPRVIDINPLGRKLLLEAVILPFRPKASAEAYRTVWTDRGSPLLFHGRDLAEKVRARLGDEVPVELAMRYGNPGVAPALERLRAAGVVEVVVLALFPQYSSAAWGSAVEHVMREAGRRWNVPALRVVPPFFAHPAYLRAFAAVARPLEEFGADRVLLSFHGVPVRQIRRGDPTGGRVCLARPGCCDVLGPENRSCYRAQCFASARAIADTLGLPDDRWEVTFQSRLGRTPWIEPYTDARVESLAREGVRRLAVTSPAFVADCLETLEELGMRAKESFLAAGGQDLRLIPALNADDAWAEAVVEIAGLG